MKINQQYEGRIRVVCPDRDFPLGRKTTVYDLATGEEIQNVRSILIYLDAGETNKAEITFGNVDSEDYTERMITTVNPEVDLVAFNQEG